MILKYGQWHILYGLELLGATIVQGVKSWSKKFKKGVRATYYVLRTTCHILHGPILMRYDVKFSFGNRSKGLYLMVQEREVRRGACCLLIKSLPWRLWRFLCAPLLSYRAVPSCCVLPSCCVALYSCAIVLCAASAGPVVASQSDARKWCEPGCDRCGGGWLRLWLFRSLFLDHFVLTLAAISCFGLRGSVS